MPDLKKDKEEVAVWARGLLDGGQFVVLDTETTGLDGSAEIIQIGIIDHEGNAVMDTLCRPKGPIPPEAAAVHGITDEQCAAAPSFSEVYQTLCQALDGKIVVIYNLAYDRRLLAQTCALYGLEMPKAAAWQCAMLAYAQWYGSWNQYRGSYRWMPLTGGDHTALGDVRATYRLLQEMAGG